MREEERASVSEASMLVTGDGGPEVEGRGGGGGEDHTHLWVLTRPAIEKEILSVRCAASISMATLGHIARQPAQVCRSQNNSVLYSTA